MSRSGATDAGSVELAPLAYFTTRFPVRSETAVIKEIHEIAESGHAITVFSLKPANYDGIHDPKAERFRENTLEPSTSMMARSLVGHLGLWLRLDRGYFGALRQTFKGGGRHLPKLLWLFLLSPGLAAEVRGRKARYVHANFSSFQAYAAWLVNRITGIPFGFTMHAHDIFQNRFLLAEKVRDAALVASISGFNIRYIEEVEGIKEPHVRLVRCGVDLAEFEFSERGEPGDPLRILMVGRFHPMKGTLHLVRACARLPAGLRFRAELIGGGEEEDLIRKEIASLGLGDRVVIRSGVSQEELVDAYRTSDAMVLPCQGSRYGTMDGIPATLMEAMACGAPVITTAISGIPELVEHDETGLVVPTEDPDAIASALQRLAGESGLLRKLSVQGRRKVEEDFDIKRNTQKLLGHIRQVLADQENARKGR